MERAVFASNGTSFEEKGIDIYCELEFSIEREEEDTSVEDGLEGIEYQKAVLKDILKRNYKMYIVAFLLMVCVLGSFGTFLKLLQAIGNADSGYLIQNPIMLVFKGAVPFVLWVFSTLYDEFNFHDRKKAFILYCLVNAGLVIAHILCAVVIGIFVPIIASIPIGRDISLSMLYNLARLVVFIVTVVPTGFLIKAFIEAAANEVTMAWVFDFKLGKQVDFRKNVEYSYDIDIVRDLKTGESRKIKEKDRFLHGVANGVTGGGKTSLVFTNTINDDMEKIVFNKEAQKKEIKKLLDNKSVRLTKCLEDRDFFIGDFEGVTEEGKNALDDLKKKIKVAGITAMAPNAAFADEIYALAKSKGISKVNRIDPTLNENGKLKAGFVGFNPLYMNPELKGVDYILEVSRKAVMFADVAQAIYDSQGQSDVYFASLNRNITTTVTIMVLMTYPALHRENPAKYPKKVATPEEIQEVLNDFSRIQEYRRKFLELYGEKNAVGNVIMEAGKAKVKRFQQVLDVVDSELLGPGAEKMFDQARGLRIIINSFLTNPLIREVLCAEDSVDMDYMLAKGEITLVNFALELGEDAKAFGLFFLLSFINAVYRRKGTEHTRTPHFFFIDELPVLLHPKIEECFALFRQYRVAMMVAIQSLSQMQKSKATAYMKDVLTSNCAHHFVFGRCAPEEMELYEKLAGTSKQIIEMHGITEEGLTAKNPGISFSTRENLQREVNMAGSDIRQRDFQEVTIVTVDSGNPVALFHGKMNFLQSHKRIKKKLTESDWTGYWPKEESTLREECSKEEENKKETDEVGNEERTDMFFDKKEAEEFQKSLLTNLLGTNTNVKEENISESEPIPEKEVEVEQVFSEETDIIFDFDE